jgi:hypothetical protein
MTAPSEHNPTTEVHERVQVLLKAVVLGQRAGQALDDLAELSEQSGGYDELT